MTEEELIKLCLPHFMERYEALRRGTRLVHYTTAEAAYQIIAGRQLWLRNAQVMNDFSEIQHGIMCLHAGWQTDGGRKLQEMLDRIKPGLRNELASLFDSNTDDLRTDTYIASLSEHACALSEDARACALSEDARAEDTYGRLSMWRAYGGRAGVALVLNPTAFTLNTTEMQVFSSPVLYKDVKGFVEWFEHWAHDVVAAEDRLRTLAPDFLRDSLFRIFRIFALCTKHPGFTEEREWRVFYSSRFEGESSWIKPSIEIVHSVPQQLMKLDLRDEPTKNIIGVAPATLLNRVIIGPCQHPLQVQTAMIAALKQAGIANPEALISMSLIPLRQ